jgi:hypothetical protein
MAGVSHTILPDVLEEHAILFVVMSYPAVAVGKVQVLAVQLLIES